MKKIVFKKLLTLHRWLGVFSVTAVFVVSYSGIFALFDEELTLWENPEQRIPFVENLENIELNRLLSPVLSSPTLNTNKEVIVILPDDHHPSIQVHWKSVNGNEKQLTHVHPVTGDVLPNQGRDVTDLLKQLHTDLLLPRPWGKYLVGLSGFLLMLSIISGVWMHRKFFRDAFRLRVNRSSLLRWTDLHKVIGVWLLPFHFVMAFTGALMGLGGILLIVTAIPAFDGDLEKAEAAVLGEHVEPLGISSPSYYLDEVIDQFIFDNPNTRPAGFAIEALGDKAQAIDVHAEIEDAFVESVSVTYRAEDQSVLKRTNVVTDSQGPFVRTYFAIPPIHFASYGGWWVKVMYAIMGFGLCVLMVTGTVIWLVKRSKSTERAGAAPLYFASLYVGLPVAMSCVLFASKLFPPQLEIGDKKFPLLVGLLFLVWAISALYFILSRFLFSAVRHQLTLTACLFLVMPVASIYQNALYDSWSGGAELRVDFMFCLIGIFTLWLVYRVPTNPCVISPAKQNS